MRLKALMCAVAGEMLAARVAMRQGRFFIGRWREIFKEGILPALLKQPFPLVRRYTRVIA